MIGMRDAITLARTKIRSKRLRLLITTVVSGLVFGVMAGASILVDGASTSLTNFARQNLDGRFLVQGSPNFMGPIDFNPSDATLLAEVQKYHAAYLTERKAAAKKYEIEYDERSEPPPYTENNDPQVPPEFRKSVDFSSPAYQRYAKDHPPKTAARDLAAFREIVTPLGATRIFEPHDIGFLGLALLPKGTEDLSKPAPTGEQPKELQTAIGQGQYTLVDDDLVEPFIAKANSARTPAQGIPVLISADDAVTTFGSTLDIPKRPKDKGAQIRWFNSVRAKVNGATYVACHRNDAERARVEEARQQAQEIAANASNKEYVQPELILALPTTPCGAVTVAKDTRSPEVKKAQDNQKAFEQEFNPAPAPRAELVAFQVVGLLPSPATSASGIDAVLAGLVGTNYGFGAVVPRTSLAALPEALRHDSLLSLKQPTSIDPFMGPVGQDTFIASFPTVEKARTAVTENSCGLNWTPECQSAPFNMQTYGTNYLAVDDIVRQLRPLIIALLVIAFGIATIIIWAMMGRVIADSRRETAVFRAIGAKRSDIASVYVLYSLWVASRIALFAVGLGVLVAGIVHVLYAKSATQSAQLAYAVFTPEPKFSFLGFGSPVLWWILIGIVAMSLVAITPPLLRNIRRNPIKDMRDE